jgi:hypothetical protein
VESGSAADSGDAGRGTPIVFISDASAEAGRINQTLVDLGYAVADVPLALLSGRVVVQRPALVICDADAEGSVEALTRVRELTEGGQFPIIILGTPERLAADLPTGLADASFARPVETRALIERIEKFIGAPRPRVKRSRSSRPPGRQSTAPSRPPERSARLEGPPSLVGGAIPLPPDLTGEGPTPKDAGDAPVVELSREILNVLSDAERRLSESKPLPQSGREEHEPEIDAEGPLPPEVLLALEEPLDDEDFSEESQTPVPADGTGALTGSRLGVLGYAGGTFATSLGTDATAAPASESSGGFQAGRVKGTSESMQERSAIGELLDQEARRARQQASTPKPPKPAPSEPAPALPSAPPPPAVASAPPPTASENAIPEPPAFSSHSSEIPIPTSRPGNLPPSSAFDDPSLDERPDEDRLAYVRRALSSTTPPMRRKDESEPSASASLPLADGKDRGSERPSEPRAVPGETSLTVPSPLRSGEAVVALAKAIARRYTGALAFEVDEGIRRAVLRDGDLVTVATGVHGESLVAFLASRGDLPAEVARQAHKLPAFGRRAGAALIAHGHLAQDQLWPVLRAHAEWLVGKILEIERGSVASEEIGRLADEPAVFGGATGAEVLVEVVRRVITPEEAMGRLGGLDAELTQGPSTGLLGECALPPAEAERIQQAVNTTVRELIDASPDPALCSTLYALVCLGVLTSAGVRAKALPERPRPVRDELDDEALRARIMARKALVDEGDYFAVLGVSRDATGYDIRRAFTTLRRELEPSHILTSRTADLADVVVEIISVIEEAYQILSDQRRRERYRRAIEATP